MEIASKNYDIILKMLDKSWPQGMFQETLTAETGISHAEIYLRKLIKSGHVEEKHQIGFYKPFYLITTEGKSTVNLPGGYEKFYNAKMEEIRLIEQDKRLQRENWKVTTKTAKWSIWLAIASFIVSVLALILSVV